MKRHGLIPVVFIGVLVAVAVFVATGAPTASATAAPVKVTCEQECREKCHSTPDGPNAWAMGYCITEIEPPLSSCCCKCNGGIEANLVADQCVKPPYSGIWYTEEWNPIIYHAPK